MEECGLREENRLRKVHVFSRVQSINMNKSIHVRIYIFSCAYWSINNPPTSVGNAPFNLTVVYILLPWFSLSPLLVGFSIFSLMLCFVVPPCSVLSCHINFAAAATTFPPGDNYGVHL